MTQHEIDRAFGNLMFMLEEDKKAKERESFKECQECEGPDYCDVGCPMKRLYTPGLPPEEFNFVCTEHRRLHRCGTQCKLKICNHEGYTCPLTSMVIPMSIIDEDSSTSGARRIQSAHANGLKNGDSQSDKNFSLKIKSEEAINEGLELCRESLINAGIDMKSFGIACAKYLAFLHKKAKPIAKNLTTKRSISHFSLAMVFMHRTGYSMNEKKTLFRKMDKINDGKLPKSHGLSKKKFKMRAITRIQDSLRKHIRGLVHAGSEIEKQYVFPSFKMIEN